MISFPEDRSLTIDENKIPSVHRETLRTLMSSLGTFSNNLIKLCLVHEEKKDFYLLVVTPSNKDSSQIEICFYGDEDGSQVGLTAGVNVSVSVSDLFGETEKNWRQFLENIVRGIVQGTLRETIQYRGSRIAQSTFSVNLGTTMYSLTRTNIPNVLLGLGRKRYERVISYAPYVTESTPASSAITARDNGS